MTKSLTITELCRRTGVTSRALRFYDERGLVVAERTAGGQRCYGPAEIARLHQVTTLKRAGFSLTQIGWMLGGQRFDLARLIDAQLAALEVERERVDEAAAALRAAKARLDAGRAIDVETFCTLIKDGEQIMSEEGWKTVADRYFSPEEQARWNATMTQVPGDFDPMAYNAKWIDLGSRIAAALPMDSTSDKARAFYDEWQTLLAPFTAVATPEMMAGASKLYDKMGEWSGQAGAAQSPFPMAVWEFIKSVGAAKKA